MNPQKAINGDSLEWLLEHDPQGVRYLALKDLVHLADDHPELGAARAHAHTEGAIAEVLSHMDPGGFWVKPGPGYSPKYFSTVWSLILLAQLGARCDQDHRISIACRYLLDHTLAEGGQFSTNRAPSGTIDCLQGNLCSALLDLGCEDPRLDLAFDWMARTVTGDGLAPSSDNTAKERYYAYKCGPGFACGANNGRSCAWGAAKVMLAFSRLPESRRTPGINKAIRQGIEFLFSVELSSAQWPSGYSDKPSSNWWKFGFPLFYVSDLLQISEVLVSLGYANDLRMKKVIQVVLQKQDQQGRWQLEYDYSGKTWVEFGKKKQPNKWTTLRALKFLDQLQISGYEFSSS